MAKGNKILKILLLVVTLTALFAAPSFSKAAPAADYGSWYGSEKGDLKSYDADIKPFNTDTAEEINTTCVLNDGSVLDDDGKQWLNMIFSAGTQVYNGEFDLSDNIGSGGAFVLGDRRDKIEDAEEERGVSDALSSFENGGYAEGAKGYQDFLRDEKKLLQQGKWVPYEYRQIDGDGTEPGEKSFAYQLRNDTWVQISNEAVKGGTLTIGETASLFGVNPGIGPKVSAKELDVPVIKRRDALAGMIDTNVNSPFQSLVALPSGCVLADVDIDIPQDIGELFDDPTDFVVGVITGLIVKPVSFVNGMVSETAWQWTFWTPHSERGDLIWNTPPNCVAGADTPFIAKRNLGQYCQGTTPLGFKKGTKRPNEKTAPYVSVANFLQWMISGIYFVIIFLSIVIFIVRGNKARILNMMQTIPRLLLSILLTLFSAFIIGAVISFANLLVLAVFGSNNSYDIGAVNAMISQPSGVVGGIGEINNIFNLIVWTMVTFFFVIFTIGALVRQIALVILVVTAPIAFFCLVNPNWQQYLYKWIRTLLVVAFMPVVLAFLLKISMSVNPVVVATNQTYGTSKLGLLSIFLMVATLWLMSKVVRSSKNFIMGQSSMATGAMGSAGGWMSQKGENTGKWNPAGMLARRAGGNMSTSAQNAEGLASMVPSNKILGGGGAALAAAGGGGAMGGARALMGGSIGPQHAQGRVGSSIKNWSSARRISNEFGEESIQEMTPESYAKYKAYVKSLMDQDISRSEAERQAGKSLGGVVKVVRGKPRLIRKGTGVIDEWEKTNDMQKHKNRRNTDN